MHFELIPFASGLIRQQAVKEIASCNEYSQQFGLLLTEAQAAELVETRSQALSSTGRIEFGGGIIAKMIRAFCDSPYLYMGNYAQTLHELVEIFYYYKNETMDLIGDDDLIAFMKSSFDGTCQGSLELLSGRELYQLAKNLRFGSDQAKAGSIEIEEDDDE